MGKYVEVDVTFDGKMFAPGVPNVKVYRFDPDLVDSIKWVVSGVPKGHSVVIKWDVESPFQNFGAEYSGVESRVILKATGLKGIGGFFRYSILLVDGAENVVAGIDPGSEVHPPPPSGGNN